MTVGLDTDLQQRLETIFADLNSRAARRAFPAPLALASALDEICKTSPDGLVRVPSHVPALFATAAVEIWLRAIHSFLISAAVTDASPIWAGISGYYSSHYCIRAFAHLLGYFQLFRRKRIACLESAKPMCSFLKKNAAHREHSFYWRIVKQHPSFAGDPLFTENLDDADESDAANRNRTTYGDHLSTALPQFRVLDEAALRNRVHHISLIEFDAPPIPRRDRAPDIDAVQIVAYHRIVRFRRLLDQALGSKSRFWAIHRRPSWASEWTDFQLVETRRLAGGSS